MAGRADAALRAAGHDTGPFKALIRGDMPRGYRATTLEDGAAAGEAVFSSQAMLNHVPEEELLHLRQKAAGRAGVFGPGTAAALDEEIHGNRQFPLPGR